MTTRRYEVRLILQLPGITRNAGFGVSPRAITEFVLPIGEMSTHCRDVLLVGAVCSELAVRDAGEKPEGLGEHRSVEPRVVLHEECRELVAVVATAHVDRVHVKEIAWCPSVEH